MLIPKQKVLPAFIFEFKFTGRDKVDLNVLADDALKQIEEKKYDTELLSSGITNIIKIGVAFRGKTTVVKK